MVWVVYFKSPDCTHGRCLRETHWLVVSPNNNPPSRYHSLSSIPCFGRHWRHITQGNWTRHCPPLCSCERPGSPRGRKLHWKTGQRVSTIRIYSVIPGLRDFHSLRWNNLTIHQITSQMGFAKAKHMASLKPWIFHEKAPLLPGVGTQKKQQQKLATITIIWQRLSTGRCFFGLRKVIKTG